MTLTNFAPPSNPWFKVRFLRYAYMSRGIYQPARWMTWSVQAKDETEALKVARIRYRRAEQFSIEK